MKFMIEVLEEWPDEAKNRGGFIHTDITDSKLQIVLHEDNVSITASVFQAPFLDEIPERSLLKITRID
ncbi:MAG: hypothetical protein U0989_06660 [Azonexus sp.]|nr:hypothetical protein [Azonexus sp.]